MSISAPLPPPPPRREPGARYHRVSSSTRLGIEARAAALKARADRATAAGIEAALVRLTAPTAMGALFKALALSATDWPAPAGFESSDP